MLSSLEEGPYRNGMNKLYVSIFRISSLMFCFCFVRDVHVWSQNIAIIFLLNTADANDTKRWSIICEVYTTTDRTPGFKMFMAQCCNLLVNSTRWIFLTYLPHSFNFCLVQLKLKLESSVVLHLCLSVCLSVFKYRKKVGRGGGCHRFPDEHVCTLPACFPISLLASVQGDGLCWWRCSCSLLASPQQWWCASRI